MVQRRGFQAGQSGSSNEDAVCKRGPTWMLVWVLVALVGGAVSVRGELCFAQASELKPGDTAVTIDDRVRLGIGEQLIAELAKGTVFTVSDLHDSWVGGHVTIDGQRRTGWIHKRHLRPGAPAASEPPGELLPAVDAASALAALKALNVAAQLDLEGHVHALDASNVRLPDGALAYLRFFERLAVLQLSGTGIGDAALADVGRASTLEKLYLDETGVTDAGLDHLQGLSKLDVLVLEGTQVTGAGLQRLAGLTNLRTLNLGRCQVSDADLKYVSGLVNLEVLALPNTQLTGAGLIHLKPLRRLRVLNLSDTQLQDQGLMYLAGQPALRMLYVRRTAVTDDAIEKLSPSLTSCSIYQ